MEALSFERLQLDQVVNNIIRDAQTILVRQISLKYYSRRNINFVPQYFEIAVHVNNSIRQPGESLASLNERVTDRWQDICMVAFRDHARTPGTISLGQGKLEVELGNDWFEYPMKNAESVEELEALFNGASTTVPVYSGYNKKFLGYVDVSVAGWSASEEEDFV